MVNINEWIYYYFIKDEDSLPFLIEYYRPAVTKLFYEKFSYTFKNYYTIDEYYSISDCTLIDCLSNYRFDYHNSFTKFYLHVLQNRMIDLFRTFSKKTFPYANLTVSLDSKIKEDSDEEYGNIISNPYACLVHDYVMGKIQKENIFEKAKKELNELDYTIFILKQQNVRVSQIAQNLSLSQAAIRYHIKKIKIWLNQIDKE